MPSSPEQLWRWISRIVFKKCSLGSEDPLADCTHLNLTLFGALVREPPSLPNNCFPESLACRVGFPHRGVIPWASEPRTVAQNKDWGWGTALASGENTLWNHSSGLQAVSPDPFCLMPPLFSRNLESLPAYLLPFLFSCPFFLIQLNQSPGETYHIHQQGQWLGGIHCMGSTCFCSGHPIEKTQKHCSTSRVLNNKATAVEAFLVLIKWL